MLETLRIAICEDDEVERRRLLHVLDESQYPMTVTQFATGEKFLCHFQPFQYDLILMDIFMGDITGVEVVTKLRDLDPQVPVAFITSSIDFALESYRLNALKYIEKPVTRQAVAEILQLAQLRQQMVERLVLRTSMGVLSYPILQLLYIEQKGRNLLLHLTGGEQSSVPKKIDEIEDQLVEKGFLRCHKSYLVNLSYVRGIDRDLSTFAIEGGGQVHIRRESFWKVKKAYETYLFGAVREGKDA